MRVCHLVCGSHLYGLELETSDRDYVGVYLPSASELLGLDDYPNEIVENIKISSGPRNSSGDIDSKFFSLRHFMKLAAEGQSLQIEMLFARPEHHVFPPLEPWNEVVRHRALFLSKKTFTPFVRFALAQANKAVMKGDNLRWIRELIQWIRSQPSNLLHEPIRNFVIKSGPEAKLGPVAIEVSLNETGAELMKLAHRHYDLGANLKRLLDSLLLLEKKYGTRANAAAEEGLDYKSLSHAYRMVFEAEELLTTGLLSLPLKDDTRKFVKMIKNKSLPDGLNWQKDLIERIDRLEHQLAPNSGLPDDPNWMGIRALHEKILRAYSI